MSNETKKVWTKRESKRGIEPLLLARQVSNDWLESSIKTTAIRFTGGLLSALTDLREAANLASKKNLPITSLRMMLQASMEGVIAVDKDLGCDSRTPRSAVEMYESQSSDAELSTKVADQVRKWCMASLEQWAEKEQFGELALRVKKAVRPENIGLVSAVQYLRDPQTKRPHFSLITRLIADQLSGEILFEGMQRCEVVLPESLFSRGVDLMTAPKRPINDFGGENAFSMIARIHVSTVPYNDNVYFSISCAKRVWAEKMPDGGNTGSTATAYVLSPGRPVIPVGVVKKKVNDAWVWDFADEYASLNIEAKGKLPMTLKDALQNSAHKQDEWWVGLPQATRLYRRVDQHTPMESDEVELLSTVTPLLAGIIDNPLPMAVKRLTLNKKPESAMLKLADVGAAGISIADAENDEETDDSDLESSAEITENGERAEVARFREQCVQVLRSAFGAQQAGLWIIGGTPQEQDIAAKTAELLFGNAVAVSKDLLPEEVHGLKSKLKGQELKSKQRFGLRVDAWKKSGLPQAIAKHQGPKFVLICAHKEIERQAEDSVNRRAAIHAICSLGQASVHHVLPIETANTPKRTAAATQSFIHRCQSAMMDVMLAHSGYVIGAKDFVAGQIDEDHRPKSIYGIQALRKQAQRYSGEQPVSMVVFSRLNLKSNVTEMNFTYVASLQTRQSGWMPLSQSLIWLGCQRVNEGNEDWLRAEFTNSTLRMLCEIQKQDPCAIVLIDWGTLAGLWKDLTDESLQKRNPRIGHLDLAVAFPSMSFARLRYGRDAQIAVRSWSKTTYEGFREEASREPTGEYFDDGYAVTVKQLIEIDPDPAVLQRGHFIGVMSARKTFQLKRGMSCYRSMPRMSSVSEEVNGKKEKGVFEKIILTPCDKDATIPSSMDISVLCCPMGISPTDIATLVMGLRVGYAHYDDWTTLPAPLFFVRKVDDYIVKYPEAEDGVIIVNGVEVGGAEADVIEDSQGVNVLENEPEKMRIMRNVIQRELNLEFADNEPREDGKCIGDEKTSLLINSGVQDEVESNIIDPDDNDVRDINSNWNKLLQQAKSIKLVSMYPASDPQIRRLYPAMIQNKIKIQVEVPYFVKLKGYYGAYTPEKKKNIQRSWKQIQAFAFVPSTHKRPDLSHYFDWLAEKLKHPQGAYLVSARSLFNRNHIIPQADTILQNYNLTAQDKITHFMKAGDMVMIDYSPIVKKACQENDDWTLGWLIFAAAQTPSFGFAASVIDALDRVPGLMTAAALHYYVQCAAAIGVALRTYKDNQSFKEVYYKRHITGPVVPATPVESVEMHQLPTLDWPKTSIAALVVTLTEGLAKRPLEQKNETPAPVQEFPEQTTVYKSSEDGETSEIRDRLMELKTEIKSIVDKVEPGTDRFQGDVEKLKAMLGELVNMDQQIRAEAEKQNIIQARLNVLAEAARKILYRIADVDEEAIIGKFTYQEPAVEAINLADDELASIRSTLIRAEIPNKQIHDLLEQGLPPGSPRSEHIRHAKDISGLSTVVNDELIQIHRQMEDSSVFVAISDATPPEGTNADETPEASIKSSQDDSEEVLEAQRVKAFKMDSITTSELTVQFNPELVVAQVAIKVIAPTMETANAVMASDSIIIEINELAEQFEPEPVDAQTAIKVITTDVETTGAVIFAAPETVPVKRVVAVVPAIVGQPARVAAAPKVVPAPVEQEAAPVPREIEFLQPQRTEIQPVAKRPLTDTELTIDEHAMQQAHARLKTLMDLRHYGLASIYIDAVRYSFPDGSVATNCTILSALAETLDSIDCNFKVDIRLNSALRDLLTQTSVASTLKSPAHIGILAAGLMSALFSNGQLNGDGADDALWTVIGPVRQPLTRLPAISALIDHIVSKEKQGIMLTHEKFLSSSIGNKMDLEAANARSRKRAETWKKDPDIYSSFAHHGFSRAHDFIYSAKHPIGMCLIHLSRGDIKGLKRAFQDAVGKFKKPSATVMDVFRAVGEKQTPDGRYNTSAIGNIEITESFIRQYLESCDTSFEKKEVILAHEMDYLTALHSCLSKAIAEVSGMERDPGMTEQIYIQSAKTVFESILRFFDNTTGKTCLPVSHQKLLIQLPMDKLLNPSMHDSEELGVKAVTSCASVIDAIDTLLEEDLSLQPSPLQEDVIFRLLSDAQRSHIEEKRFLPAFMIEDILPKGYARLDPPLNLQYQRVKADLTRALQEARQRVTHAMALSALDQKDANHLLRLIESIHASSIAERSIGNPQGTSSAFPDFPHALATLNKQVIAILDAKVGEAKDKLMTDLREYEESKGEESLKDVDRIRSMLEKNNPASIRTAHDAFAILRNSGKLPTYILNSGRHPPTEFESFLESLSKIRKQKVLLDALEVALRSETDEGLPDVIVKLDDTQRAEAAQFIKFWKEICMHRGGDAVDLVAKFFSSLGIGAPSYLPERTGRQLPTRFEFPEKAFATLASSDCFVPPALGSNARMVVGYIITGIQAENEIPSLVQEISNPTFILSRANLTLTKRAKFSGQAPVILIDDALIAYMALHPEDRARRMMEIATLTFHTIPYSAEGTFVPREMFFGRQKELISLRAVKNLAILYGGRRLGKSSLLAQIEREESSIAGSIGIYISMDRDYDGGDDHVLYAWKKLYTALFTRGVITPMQGSENDWRKYRDWVEAQLMASLQKMKSCYLLFDEADNLMSHELDLVSGQTGFIRSLQQTSENVSSNFKLRYVIAGLHNLARMTTESNSAMGKAETIALEPFSTEDDIMRGIELVTKPMAALGFFFKSGSEDLPLRILSICNFYPAFIQIYCRKLLEHMYNKRNKEAYADIIVDDLEAVEKDHDLLSELQQKFSWTLDLDKRYKAIALILADYYYSEIEQGRNEGLTVSDIKMWCEVEVGNHFKGLSAGAYEGLVDEMKKLNVLEKNGHRYRLRNPSIAMLIGDRQRIELQLKALATMPPEKTRNHGDRRNELTSIGNSHSGEKPPIFPMPVAWTHAQMETIDGNLIIVGGNHLSGLNDVTSSRTEWQLSQNNQFRVISLGAASLNAHIAKLRRDGGDINKASRLMLMATTGAWKVNEISQLTNIAARAANNNVCLVLAANPDRLFEIAKAMDSNTLPTGRDRKGEWSLAPVPAWSVDAVRFFLHDNNAVSANMEACQAILDASCGFGKQIQSICAGNPTVESALRLVEEAKKSFAPNLVIFYDKIGMPGTIEPKLLSSMQDFMAHIHGEQRKSSAVDGYLDEFELKPGHLAFLQWMGLVQEGENNTWFVPTLYRNLL